MSIQAVAWALEQDIPARPKLVLVALANHADHTDGYCWLRAETIAKEGACEVRSVTRFIDALIRHGYIRKQQKRGEDGRQRANDYWLLFDEQKLDWPRKRRGDAADEESESDDADTTSGAPPDSQSGGDNVDKLSDSADSGICESSGPQDSGVRHKDSEEPSKSNLKVGQPRIVQAALRSYAPKTQELGDGWYERSSREGRALAALYEIIGKTHFFEGVRCRGHRVYFHEPISEQFLALADSPEYHDWVRLTAQQAAAWYGFARGIIPVLNFSIRERARAPWPWPPRKSGSAVDSDQKHELQEAG